MANAKARKATGRPREAGTAVPSKKVAPTLAQNRWLQKGVAQPGGKLPLFDDEGREISARTIRACIAAGWAEPWFSNPIKPDWLVCKLTAAGREAVAGDPVSPKP